jgi:hypothetical protein
MAKLIRLKLGATAKTVLLVAAKHNFGFDHFSTALTSIPVL